MRGCPALPTHLSPLYLLSIEVGLRLDGADGGRWPRGSPSPLAQGAPSQEQSQEECSPGGQHGGGSNSAGSGGGRGQDGQVLGQSPLSSAAQKPGTGSRRQSASSPRSPGWSSCLTKHPAPHESLPPASSTLHFPAGPWRHILFTKSELTSGSLSTTP